MDWILNNLENVVIPIIIMILYGVGSVAQKKDKGKKGKGAPREQQQPDPEEARRVQQIQEEIRRKIAERTGRVPPPIKPQARKQVQPPPRFPEPSRTPPRRSEPVPIAPTRSYQDEMAAKLRQIKELEAQAAAAKAVPAAVWGIEAKRPVSRGELRSQLFKDLSHPLGQRKAILIGEILGSPVGVKGPAGWKSNV